LEIISVFRLGKSTSDHLHSVRQEEENGVNKCCVFVKFKAMYDGIVELPF
jgi:hypothetical protein